MQMPFPGMDPYLEHPLLWPEVHTRLIVAIANQLQPLLLPRYLVSIQQRVYVETPGQERIPDVMILKSRARGKRVPATTSILAAPLVIDVPQLEIKERYLEIHDRYHDRRLVTTLELISPSNKKPGPGRKAYLAKQRETLHSRSHLVEIDLLRRGRHVAGVPKPFVVKRGLTDYLICVNRWPERTRFELYCFSLRQPIPRFRVPLAKSDDDVPLDLQTALERVYEEGTLALQVRYEKPCFPPLPPEDQKWATAKWRKFRAVHPELFPSDNGRT